MAIVKEVTIRVSNNKSVIDKPIYLYLGDGSVTLLINILDVTMKVGTYVESTNIIEEFDTKWAKVCLLKPDNTIVYGRQCTVKDNKLSFLIDKEFIDELGEEGEHLLQIHLYDSNETNVNGVNRYTIPPISLQVLKPLCDIGHDSTP